jgi:hypothetical protein
VDGVLPALVTTHEDRAARRGATAQPRGSIASVRGACGCARAASGTAAARCARIAGEGRRRMRGARDEREFDARASTRRVRSRATK